MKLFFLVSSLMVISVAEASQYSRLCSNNNRTVSLENSRGYGDGKTTVKVTRGTLGGPVTVELGGEDLKIEESILSTFKDETQNLEAYCEKTYPVNKKVYALKITITKNDGSVFVEDDTPSSEKDKIIADYLICSETTVGAWPCK